MDRPLLSAVAGPPWWGLEAGQRYADPSQFNESRCHIACLRSSDGVTQRESLVSRQSIEKRILLVMEQCSKMKFGGPTMCAWIGEDYYWERRG